MKNEKVSCICLTCGVRNDHTHPDGFCQNGHDDWLEYRDVMLIEGAEKEPLLRFAKLLGVSATQARTLFLNYHTLQFTFKPKKKPQLCKCCICKQPFLLTDLIRVSSGNEKKYACDNCYEEKYAGSDAEDETLSFLKRAEDYFNQAH